MMGKNDRVERKIALLSSVSGDLIFALEQIGKKYSKDHFVVSLELYKKVVPSEEKIWDWDEKVPPFERPFRGQLIVFERLGGEIVGWCSLWEFQKAGFTIEKAKAA